MKVVEVIATFCLASAVAEVSWSATSTTPNSRGARAPGRDLGPAIPAAENAIDAGSADAVLQLLTGTIRERVREQFEKVTAARAFDSHDVAAGRAYVRTYVEFIHYVERLHEAAVTVPHGHVVESDAHPRQH